jgi:hypothetical protein
MKDLEKLQLYILAGDHFGAEFKSIYQRTYDLWETVWPQTFKEIAGTGDITSDNFTRQHEVLSLFWKDQCCAMVCHRFVDMAVTSFLRDSYFKFWGWSDEALKKLMANGTKIALGSQITIHPDFRKLKLGGQVKELITGLSLRSFQGRSFDAVAGMMRNDKGLDRVFYDCGAFPLVKDVSSRNFKLDFVAFFPKLRPIQVDLLIKDDVERIWNNRRIDNERNTYGSNIQDLYEKAG